MKHGWEFPLILDVHGRLTRELKPKQNYDKVDNGVKPMLGLYLVSLMDFVQMSFEG